MVSVCGLKIDDGNQARTARLLMLAHCALIAIGLAWGILGIINNNVASNSTDFVAKANLAMMGPGGRPGGGNGPNIPAIVIGIILPLTCPVLGCIMVCAAISKNNEGLLQCICFFDGCCSCCSSLGGIFGILSFIAFRRQATQGEDFDCSGPSGFPDCDSKQDKAVSSLHACAILSIIAAILSFLECLTCILGTVKANQAHSSLKAGHVFTGPPRAPAMATVYGQVAAPTPAYAGFGGQVVGGTAYVGGPVAGGPVIGGPVVAGQVAAFGTPVYGQVVGGPMAGAPIGHVVQPVSVTQG